MSLAIDATDAAAHGGASARADGRIAGAVTSGGWGHRTGLNLAYAFVESGLAAPGSVLSVDLGGEPLPARVIDNGPYDPGNRRVKA